MDDLDELLTPRTRRADAMPLTLSDAAWQNTRGVLRRRRWVRRGGQLVVLAIVFTAGAMTYRSFDVRESPGPHVAKMTMADLEKLDQPRPKLDVAERFRNASPDKIERFANMAEPDKRVELYCMAGDRYLDRGDHLSALKCYQRALDGGGPDSLVVKEQDTWLMMSLKKDRQQKEN